MIERDCGCVSADPVGGQSQINWLELIGGRKAYNRGED